MFKLTGLIKTLFIKEILYIFFINISITVTPLQSWQITERIMTPTLAGMPPGSFSNPELYINSHLYKHSKMRTEKWMLCWLCFYPWFCLYFPLMHLQYHSMHPQYHSVTIRYHCTKTTDKYFNILYKIIDRTSSRTACCITLQTWKNQLDCSRW